MSGKMGTMLTWHLGRRAVGLVALLTFAASSPSLAQRSEVQRDNLRLFNQVWATVNSAHWDASFNGLDWAAVRREFQPRIERAESVTEARQVLQEMLSRLRQSHFAIHAANVGEESDPALRAECQDGSCGLDVRVLGDQAVVFRVAEGSTAQRCGIREGWCIRRINGSGIGAVLSDVKKKFRSSTQLDYQLAWCAMRELTGPVGRERPHRFSRRKRSCSLCSRSLRAATRPQVHVDEHATALCALSVPPVQREGRVRNL